ncbi:hypothetical protein [Rufibacter sp. XAAS-G3-1]|uniref:hypothetical protein n=1 Tax=Rufibacter sp. XAAS-G3-1 TaxID=2729134 RepID=UPI0015E68300|nr:hypothetical protein [Rufibacter sp. XAAS-G3-1]
MKKVLDENVIPLFQEEQKPQDSAWRKSIPAQVFLNYFFAINYHISHSPEEAGLRNNAFFRQHSANLSEQELEALARILHNSWSTEYALRATAELGDETYLRNALHWTFPQAYYSIFAGLQAFLYTLGTKTNHEAAIKREAGRLVVKNAYPRAIGYYAAGAYNDFSIHRLPLAGYKAGLQIAGKEIEAQAQIGQFLRTTRKLTANAIRQQVQKNPATAIKSSKTGKVLDKWSSQHWQQITWRMGYTTLFDLLSRLRISSTQKEIERFVEAQIDFKLFHECLLSIVSYMNGLHESYVAQAIGLEKYRKVVAELPEHLRSSFVKNRLHQMVEPLFPAGTTTLQLSAAA